MVEELEALGSIAAAYAQPIIPRTKIQALLAGMIRRILLQI
jgi:hypothetical protein